MSTDPTSRKFKNGDYVTGEALGGMYQIVSARWSPYRLEWVYSLTRADMLSGRIAAERAEHELTPVSDTDQPKFNVGDTVIYDNLPWVVQARKYGYAGLGWVYILGVTRSSGAAHYYRSEAELRMPTLKSEDKLRAPDPQPEENLRAPNSQPVPIQGKPLSGPQPEEKNSVSDDAVEHPAHYNQSKYTHAGCGKSIECWDVVEMMTYNLGNVVKYVWRADSKHESPLEDLKKAQAYIAREIARLEQEETP